MDEVKKRKSANVSEYDGYKLIDHELTEEELQERIKKYYETCEKLGLDPLPLKLEK